MNAMFWFAAAWLSIPTQAATPPRLLRFRASFDRTSEAALASGPRAPRLAENVTFVPGKFGQAVFFGKQTHLDYAARGNLDKQQGTVCMWVRPNWPGADGKNHGFFSDSLNFNDLSSNNLYL